METLQNYLTDMQEYEGMCLDWALKFMTRKRATFGLEKGVDSYQPLSGVDTLIFNAERDGNF